MPGLPRLLPHPAVCAPADVWAHLGVCAHPGVCAHAGVSAHPAMHTLGPWPLQVSGGQEGTGGRCGC